MIKPSPWPLVPRGALVDAVAGPLQRGMARAVIIVGPAGVGKTVLAQQAAERFADRRVFEVVGLTELAAVPLGAFAPLLVHAGIDAAGEHAVHDALALVGKQPGTSLLVVDDAPRLDAASAATVYQAVRGFGVPLIATGRAGESLPEALARLESEGLATRIDLDGLSLDEASEVLARRFGAPAAHGDVVRLRARTGGNPLYMRMLVEGAVRDGAVTVADGVARVAEGPAPPDLVASLVQELARLDPGARTALRLIALTQPVDLADVRAALGGAWGVEAVIAGGWAVAGAGERALRVGHPLVGEAIARHTDTDAAIGVAVRLLVDSGEPGRRYAAVRLQREHGAAPDADGLRWAAEYALGLGDMDSAVDLARASIDAPGRHAGRCRALVVLGAALSVLGRLAEADDAFADARSEATTDDDLVRIASRWGEHLAFKRFDVARAVETATAIRAGISPAAAEVLDPEIALWRGILGEVHDGAGLVSGEEAHPEAAIRAAMAAIMTQTMSARTDAAREAAAVIERIQQRTGVLDPMATAVAGFDVYIDLLSRGDHEPALEWARSRRYSAGDGVGIWTCTVAEHLNYNGLLAEARPLAALAVDQCTWRDPIGVLPLALALHADVTAKSGDLQGARAILGGMAPAQRAEPKAILMIAECEAWLAHAEGDTERAVAIIEDAATAAMGVGFALVASISLALCVRLGHPARAADMLDAICAKLPPHLTLCFAIRDVAAALRDRDPNRMPKAARALAAAGMAPTALDALALARRMRPGTESARHIDLTYLALAARVDAPLLQARRAPLLTARELEIARDAALRMRSREIAERRGVSVRTVDNQLQAVYRKLGVSSRDELRALLNDGGLGDDAAAADT